MKQKMRFALLLLVTVAFATSCSKKAPKQTQYIPKDAFFVLGMDLKSLTEKSQEANINWDSLVKSSIDVSDDTSFAKAKNKWNDFRASGVDTAGSLYMFVKMGGSIMSGQSTSVGFVAGLMDAAKFEDYIKKQSPDGGIKKESTYSWAKVEGYAIGWNSDVIILSSVINSGGYSDSTKTDAGTQAQAQLTALFAQKETDAVSSIPQFSELMEEKADMTFWTNSSGALGAVALLGVTKFGDLLKDAYTAGTVNFEDGKVTANYKSYSGGDLGAMFKKYAGPTANMDMVNKYPSQVEGFAAFSFNPQLIIDIIKYSGFDGMANQYMADMGFGLDDIAKAFKGEFAVVFSDIGEVEKPNPYDPGTQMKEPTGKLIFNAAIGDKATYDKIVSKLADKGLMIKQGNQYVPKDMGTDGTAMNTTDKNIVVATDSALLNQYISGNAGKANLPADIADKAKGKSLAFYVDINRILRSFTPSPGQEASMNNAKATFKDASATVGNYDGKMTTGNMELRTMNDKENSLATLIKFFVEESRQIKAEKERMNGGGMVDMDSTTAPMLPPPSK